MLVLSRKANESLVIDGNVTVRVLGINGNRVRLGIEAPPEIRVRRAELAAEASDKNDEEQKHGSDSA
jgi:carbon storage regulator